MRFVEFRAKQYEKKLNKKKMIMIKIIFFGLICFSTAQQNHVNLKQGTLVGLKVFPDSARSAVYAFLGVPYAEPPIGDLRFAPPKIHNGWNRTLQAMNMKPICPQLSNTIYDETPDQLLARPAETNEDCLYLNIWVSENGLRYGNLPVLVILTGEDMSYDWPRNRVTGLDLAAEGFVVITLQYRTNIFGWINVPESNELSGNFGLQDQTLALEWIQENIKSLGGNPSKVTLLGHGTSGGPCALLHFILNKQVSYSGPPLAFNQLILMSSGEIEKIIESPSSVQEASKVLVQKLGCQFEEYSQQLVSCLRSKSVSDLLKAFESIYDNGNGTYHLGPSMHINLKETFSNSTIIQSFPTTMMGITSNEGAFLQDYWLELARDSYASLRSYINYTLIEKVFPAERLKIENDINHSVDALNWRYFSDNAEEGPVRLLEAIQTFLSEYYYEMPFYRLLNQISNATELPNNMYAYIYDFSNTMDIRGKVNFFGGASHTSDLPLLFGPTLFQQIARRRFNSDEEKMFRKIRTPFINFIKNGNPTPGRTYDGWLPFTKKNKFIYNLGDTWSPAGKEDILKVNTRNIQQIAQLLENKPSIPSIRSTPTRNEFTNSYQMPKAFDRAATPVVTTSSQNSEYISHLVRVYGFWQVFLPQATFLIDGSRTGDDTITQRLLYMEASADAARYRHGFFVMLALVSILLALLCLCVYLLRRDPLSPSTHFDCDL